MNDFSKEWQEHRLYRIQPVRMWRWDRIFLFVYLLAGTFLSAWGTQWYV